MGRRRGMLLHPPQVQPWLDQARVTSGECAGFAIHDLAAVADGNLSPQGLQRLTDHLRGCPTCTATLVAIVEDGKARRGGESHRLAAWLAAVPWPGGPRTRGGDTGRAGES